LLLLLTRRGTLHRWRHRHRLAAAEYSGNGGDAGPPAERRPGGGRPGTAGITPRPDVDDSEFDERREREDETRRHPDVDRFDVGHARQLTAGRLQGDREDRQQSEVDAGDDGVDAEPERHPRQDDGQHARDVVLHHEVGEVAFDNEYNFEARKRTGWIHCTIYITLYAYTEEPNS